MRVIVYFVYFENKPIHIKAFVWRRSSNIPDMLNPYCYKIFALFHLQSPIMLWLRYCLKCPHNCRAKKDNCSEFYIINQTKIVKPKLTTWIESGLEKDLSKTHLTEYGDVIVCSKPGGQVQILTHSFASNLERQILCQNSVYFVRPRQLSHLT